MIAPLLGLRGEERRQAGLLADAYLAILWRGQTVVRKGKKKSFSPFTMILWMNLFLGTMFVFSTGIGLPPSVCPLIWMGMGFCMAGTLIAGDFALSLIEHQDGDILFHHPVTSRMLYGARLLYIQKAVLLVTLGFFVGPAMATMAISGWSPLAPVLYMAGGLLQVIFLTLAILGIYSLLVRWMHVERVKVVAGLLNVVLSVGLILSYQGQAVWGQLGGTLEDMRGDWWTYLLPIAWYAAPLEMLRVGPRLHLAVQTALGLGAIPILAWLASRILGRQYQEKLARGTEHRRLGLRGPRWLVFGLLRRVFWVRRGPEAAGFDVVARQFGLAKMLQMSFGILALTALFAWQGKLADPLRAQGKDLFVGSWIQGLLVLLPAVMLSALRTSPFAAARWIFEVAPLGRYGDFYAGAKKALLVSLVLLYLAVGVMLSFFWSPLSALLYVLLSMLGGAFLMHVASLWWNDLPFSEEPAEGSRGCAFYALLFGGIFVAFGFGGLGALALFLGSGYYAGFWGLVVLCVFLAGGFSRWMLNRRSPLARPAE